MKPTHLPKSEKAKKRKAREVIENEVIVSKPIEGIEYPEHLQRVNYLSLDSFEASIEDHVTHKTYHQAIMENQHLFNSKVVLHITEGSNCLYSMFAAKAGASKVYCVVNGDSAGEMQNIFMMKEIVKQNNLEDRIQILSWSSFNAEVDVIVGEPMGYCLHFDGLLDRIIEARDLYLVKNGIIFPNSLSFKCGIIHDEHFLDHKINYWDDVYGVPMGSMKKWISHEPLIRIVDPEMIVSKVTKLLTFNLQTISYSEAIKIDRVFQVELMGPCKANGIAFWFETFFDYCTQKKDIKASPWVESTKYTQVTLYWPSVLDVEGKLTIRLKGQKHPKEGYSVLSTQIDDKIYQYSFS